MNTGQIRERGGENVRGMWADWERKTYQGMSSYTRGSSPQLIQELEHGALRTCMINRLARVTGNRRFDRVVDLGCAAGDWTAAYLRTLARTAAGTDINASFIEEGRSRYRAQIESGRLTLDAVNLVDFDDYEGADLVCVAGCLMFVDDSGMDPFFEKLTKKMNPDGYVYVRASVSSPRRKSYMTKKGFYRNSRDYERLFQKHGLRILDAVSSVTVVAHELLRVTMGFEDHPQADETLKVAVENISLLSKMIGRRNNYMNWVMKWGG